MGTEAERQDTRKAMVYDILKILKKQPDKQSYTVEELETIFDTYLTTANQK